MKIHNDIAPLLLNVAPISPATTVDQAADLFLEPQYERMLSIAVVDDDRAVGVVSRFQLNQIFLRRYGRELHGRHPVARVMNASPLRVASGQSLEDAAAYLTANISAPMREDFIIIEGGRYTGMGIVLDLLRAMQKRVSEGAAKLNEAYGQLKSSQAQLVQSEKMASLGQMVAGMAHEINTPLGYVRNNVEMLSATVATLGAALAQSEALLNLFASDGSDEAAINRQLELAQQAIAELREAKALDDTAALCKDTIFGVDQIRDLVVNLRNFTRLDQAKVADASLHDCIDQTLVIANAALKNKAAVIKRYGEIPRVRCSPSQINQVLLNLFTNAAQAIEHHDGKLLLKTERDGNWVRISVQDNGKGIPPENLKKIFDPFFTTKAAGHGTGLGLSISYQIVQAHGGTLQVASKPGVGTRFVVSLPIEEQPAAAPAPAADAIQAFATAA